MKKILFFTAFLLVYTISFGQKVGSIDYNKILAKMPEYKMAESEYKKYSKVLEDSITNEYKVYLNLKEDYTQKIESGRYLIGSEIEKSTAKKIKDLEQKITYWNSNFQKVMDAKNAEFIANVQKKLNKVITEYAKENGFNIVIYNDSSIYSDKEIIDITNSLSSRLGL